MRAILRRAHRGTKIRKYAEELAQYLNEGYLAEYEFGFKRDGNRVVSWRYKVDEAGTLTTDDKAGKIAAYSDVSGATFFNFLMRNTRYANLPATEQKDFLNKLPINRTSGTAPGDGLGYWTSDRNYHSGGRSLGRQTFQLLS
ncbi:MAG: hypothetical protein WDO13_08290 [Verrucomicrobiota bacterium]